MEKVLEIAKKVQTKTPELFAPLADFFGIDIDARLNNPSHREGLFYPEYA